MLAEGDTLPDVLLQDADGATFALARYAGKPVVVYFYPKADTPGCTSEARDFTALAADFAALGVPVVAISKDKPARLKKFADKYGLAVTLASDDWGDAPGAVCAAFGVWVEKTLYGRNYMGIARATFLADASGTIIRVWPKVKVKGHAAEVLEAAKAL